MRSSELRPVWLAIAISLLALAVRLLAVGHINHDSLDDVDESEYLTLAQNLNAHGVLSYGRPYHWGNSGQLNAPGPFEPTATRAPLYPAMLSLLSWQAPPPLLGIRLLQAILGGLVAAFTYLAARRAFDPTTALLAGVATALAPASVEISVEVMSENLFTVLLMAGLWLWGEQRGVLAGVLLGLATLARAVLLPFMLLVALAALLFRFNRGLHIRLAIVALLVVAPWTARNAVTQHAFIPIASLGWGANLLMGTVDTPYGAGNVWVTANEDATLSRILSSGRTPSETEANAFHEGLHRIVHDPLGWVLVRLKQYPRLFVQSPMFLYPLVPFPQSVIKIAYIATTAVFIALAFAGMVLARDRWRDVYHLAAFPLFLMLAQLPMLTEERYGLPMVPMLVAFAAFAAFAAIRIFRRLI